MFPREKFLKRGVESLRSEELVAILLSTGSKRKGFMKTSREVVDILKQQIRNDDLRLRDLEYVYGVGKVKAMKVFAGIELGRRLYGLTEEKRPRIHTTEDAYEYVKDISKGRREHLVALFLNARFELIRRQDIAVGSHNVVSVNTRDVVIPALELNAAYIVVAHNHPSGDPSPSEEDVRFTRKLKKASDLVSLSLLDHIVVSDRGWEVVEI